MICKNCGSSISDTAEVCGNCGAVQNNVEKTTAYEGGEVATTIVYPSLAKPPKQKKSYKKIVRIIVSLVVVLGIIAFSLALIIPNITLITSVGKFKEFAETGDGTILYEELMPPFFMEFLEDLIKESDQDFDDEYEAMLDSMEESLEETRNELEEELGTGIEYSFRVTDIDIGDEEDINDCIERYEDMDMKKYIRGVEITDYVILNLDVTITGSEHEKNSNLAISMMKIDGKWYIEDFAGM